MRYRPATDDDVAALVPLVHSAYRGESSRAGWTSEAHLLDGNRIDGDQLRALLADPAASVTVVTDDDDMLLGCFELRRRRADLGYFGMFVVRPGRQGEGLGRQILAEAERQGRESLGVGALELTVIAQRTELIAWYERRGYGRTGETEPFPYGDARFGTPRREDLVFVVLRKPL